MSKNITEETLAKKVRLFLNFRRYKIETQTEEKDLINYVVTKKGEDGKTLLQVIYRTTLASGKVGVHHIRKLKEKIDKEGFKAGIIIGQGFSYSARKEAKANGIETIEERRIPIFNIFNHYLVPKHEILKKEEAEKLLEKYHIKPYQLPKIKASDPAVFLIGAKPGDIVKILRNSQTAGVHVTYRHVI